MFSRFSARIPRIVSRTACRRSLPLLLCLPTLAPGVALAAPTTAQQLAQMREAIDQLKQQYQTRISELEQRLKQTEAQLSANQQAAADTEQRLSDIELAPVAVAPSSPNRFNPSIALVLQGSFHSYSQDPANFSLAGMPLGGEAGLAGEGLSLDETEMTLAANVDTAFYGQATLSYADDAVAVEEAYIDTLALPDGFGLRFGRFFSTIGYQNSHHTHTWDFAESPLAYQAFLGGQYGDDGVRLSWAAPLEDWQLETGIELLRGNGYPAGGNSGDLGAVKDLWVKLGADAGERSSWQLGFTHMNVDTVNRAANGGATSFNGTSTLNVIDGIWKTEFDTTHKFTLQGEYLKRSENGQVSFTQNNEQGLLDYNGDQSGWYLQGVYQFAQRWRTGLRYDRVSADNRLAVLNNDLDGNATTLTNATILNGSGLVSSARDPKRWSAMVDWSPSEFSRLRLEYTRDLSTTVGNNAITLQYIMAIGAHGAHAY